MNTLIYNCSIEIGRHSSLFSFKEVKSSLFYDLDNEHNESSVNIVFISHGAESERMRSMRKRASVLPSDNPMRKSMYFFFFFYFLGVGGG